MLFNTKLYCSGIQFNKFSILELKKEKNFYSAVLRKTFYFTTELTADNCFI